MNYSQAIEYLYGSLPVFHHIGADAYKPGLENSIRLMDYFDNPQNVYRTIHIAGTNGKGSVSHFLSAILQSAGYKTGLYTSPHLVDFRERIRINGEMISENYVTEFVESNKDVFDNIKPSFFETTMAMAFKYFADNEVDIAVIETGLGGRLDSTNIILPELSIITNIGFDHTQFLGNTLEQIAQEKAGIIKTNVPAIIGESTETTKSIFIKKANSGILFAEDEFDIELVEYQDDIMIVNATSYGKLKVGLYGEYQLKNIATVLTAVKELVSHGIAIFEEDIKLGLKNVVSLTGIQGRWQILQKQPTIVVDTGHNIEGIRWVVNQLKKQHFDKLHIVFGMVSDKDVSSVLKLLPPIATYYFVQANIPRAMDANVLREKANMFFLSGNAYSTVWEGVTAARQNAKTTDFIFIGGSNFVVGEVLAFYNNFL
ncbi:MAG: bifunctional folylpolyglutamate synthase/dihydrofolate synthase [Paludibacteraceae bacterium]